MVKEMLLVFFIRFLLVVSGRLIGFMGSLGGCLGSECIVGSCLVWKNLLLF